MSQLSDLKTTDHIKVLNYGDSGAGKTCLASGFPGKIHYYDFDLKVSSAASFLAGQEKLKDISYTQYPLVKKSPGSAGRQFNDDMGSLAKLAAEGKFPYETIVFDSITTMSDRIMEYLMKENPGLKRVITKHAQAPALQDYGIFRIFFKQLIAEILSFPCNVIFTAHIQTSKDELTGAIERAPMLTGKLATELPIYFEEVYRSFVEGEGDKRKYMIQTQADRKFNCRTQRGLAPLVEAKYSNLIK